MGRLIIFIGQGGVEGNTHVALSRHTYAVVNVGGPRLSGGSEFGGELAEGAELGLTKFDFLKCGIFVLKSGPKRFSFRCCANWSCPVCGRRVYYYY